MRKKYIKLISNRIKIVNSNGSWLKIGCPEEFCDALEFELRKANRNDAFCTWSEIVNV